MLTTIEQLEREIEKFHETIASSNELFRLIKSLMNEISNQTITFSEKTSALEEMISIVPDTISADYDTMLKRFVNEKKSYVDTLDGAKKDFIETISKLEQSISTVPDNTAKANAEVLDKSLVKLNNLHSQHFNTLDGARKDFIETVSKLEQGISAAPENTAKANAEVHDKALVKLHNLYEQYANTLVTARIDFIETASKLEQGISTVPDNTAKANAEVLEKSLAKLHDLYVHHVDTLERITADIAKEIEAYRTQLTDIQKVSKATEASINEKYISFLSKLETLNIEQVYKICQEIKAQQGTLGTFIDENQKSLITKMETMYAEQIHSIKSYIDRKVLLILSGISITIVFIIIYYFTR